MSRAPLPDAGMISQMSAKLIHKPKISPLWNKYSDQQELHTWARIRQERAILLI